MRRENPRTFRLSADALAALARIHARTGRPAAQIIEELVLDADREGQREDLRGRVETLEDEVRRLKEGRSDDPTRFRLP